MTHEHPYTILIVDDHVNNLFTLHSLLKSIPRCMVVEAGSGEAALGIMIEQTIDLVLLDIQMPGMNGFEMAKLMKMTDRTRQIPIIFITAIFRAEEFIRQGYEIGAVDYLTKPLDDNLLLNRVQLYLRLFNRERDLQTTLTTLRQKENELARINRDLESQVLERTRDLEQKNRLLEQEIAERQKVEHELLLAKNAAEQGVRVKSEFLAAMSHEIRTPMNVVLGMSEMLLETPLNPEQHHFMTIMHRSGKVLLGVINDILDFSRMDAGQLGLSELPFSPRQVIEETTHLMQLGAKEKGLALHQQITSTVPQTILGDDRRIRQILINLLGNAIKFTHQGDIVVNLTLNPGPPETLQFSVRDTGIGITEEQKQFIFDHFTQADRSITRHYGGTGLGLAISKRLVEMMGGRIWVESQLNQGSTFHFTLPVKMDTSQPATVASPPSIHPINTKSLRILLAEDQEMNRMLFAGYFKNSTHQLTMVNDGEEAIARVQAEPFDVIIMDIQMPRMDGYTATRHIRAWEQATQRPPIKIIALSAHAMEGEQERSQQAGCDAYISKPISKKALMSRLHEMAMQPSATTRNHALRILLAEDTPENQILFKAYLTQTPHHLVMVNNGLEAVDRLQKETFDVIFMDIQMPHMDGLTATNTIRQWEQTSHRQPVIIIALSGHDPMNGHWDKCQQAGCDLYLTKPLSKKTLLHTLQQIGDQTTRTTHANHYAPVS